MISETINPTRDPTIQHYKSLLWQIFSIFNSNPISWREYPRFNRVRMCKRALGKIPDKSEWVQLIVSMAILMQAAVCAGQLFASLYASKTITSRDPLDRWVGWDARISYEFGLIIENQCPVYRFESWNCRKSLNQTRIFVFSLLFTRMLVTFQFWHCFCVTLDVYSVIAINYQTGRS